MWHVSHTANQNGYSSAVLVSPPFAILHWICSAALDLDQGWRPQCQAAANARVFFAAPVSLPIGAPLYGSGYASERSTPECWRLRNRSEGQ